MTNIPSRIKRNKVFKEIFEYLLFIHFDYINHFAKSIGQSNSTVIPFLTEEHLGRGKSESYINYLIHLGVKVDLYVIFPDEKDKAIKREYIQDPRSMYIWIIDLMKSYVMEKGLTIRSFLVNHDIPEDILTLKSIKLRPTGGSIFGFMEQFSKAGFNFFVTLEHEKFCLKNFNPHGIVPVIHDETSLKKLVSSGYLNNLEFEEIETNNISNEIRNFYNSTSAEDLVKMGKGEIFTETGDAVRPFL